MIGLLLVVLALAVGGCVCVVWAARGGPRWVRAVSRLTLGAAGLLRDMDKNRSRNRSGGSDD
ncbi:MULTISPECIES: hypothetical protein [Streptomyces]|uniref:Uncharacterized protein n=1 Tax=Streptomyces odorifer TaxID=53450 RepID=A0A7Y6F4F3_9ACTN|nr:MULTISPECIES: hypothetical protein [Streptomyces]NUV38097.1 hypothetical protein [Streptomyces sp. KAI-27]NUV45266.1 hypothetical protein [Streptomyces sp. CAI-78]MBL0799993.1 hypothetical protein [Streptomyces albidoflavus]MBV1955870.1 hypothetical protein [Streptomyces sp. BV333]MCK2139506.1 hypothetical protein [Streptomyces sp. WAC00276]